jgi:ABC-2 type transport system ATP-binding protein
MPTVKVLDAVDGRARLRVDSQADLVPILERTRRNGDVVSFAYQPPTLSELFRQAVAA